ncbi:hypothetical protein D3C72_1439100 [compost metagenome]
MVDAAGLVDHGDALRQRVERRQPGGCVLAQLHHAGAQFAGAHQVRRQAPTEGLALRTVRRLGPGADEAEHFARVVVGAQPHGQRMAQAERREPVDVNRAARQRARAEVGVVGHRRAQRGVDRHLHADVVARQVLLVLAHLVGRALQVGEPRAHHRAVGAAHRERVKAGGAEHLAHGIERVVPVAGTGDPVVQQGNDPVGVCVGGHASLHDGCHGGLLLFGLSVYPLA